MLGMFPEDVLLCHVCVMRKHIVYLSLFKCGYYANLFKEVIFGYIMTLWRYPIALIKIPELIWVHITIAQYHQVAAVRMPSS